MRNKIDNVLRYIVRYYPDSFELTKTRLTKLIYLIDWESSLEVGEQMTEIEWYFNHYGPYVSDVFDTADEDSDLKIVENVSNFGTKKFLVESKIEKSELKFELTESEIKIIDKVINDTQNMNWYEFIDYVYSTVPVVKSKKYGVLNLVKLAQEYPRVN
ncbi:Panacea domain-containing protein [Streptococcus vestibularis]|uniref:Panacea domain-containing protein n=1 Tax=Streptococcus vestibularis TaxID=1343 RepID=UPI00266EC1E7|nr:Panacea domain-containing protein [Streptococcus vestibularis]